MTHIARAILLSGALAACTSPAPKPEPLACPKPAPCPACPLCPPAKPAPEIARYEQATFSALPGWSAAALEPSLRAFLRGCPLRGALARACELGRSVPTGDEAGARRFFESAFEVYSLVSSEGRDTGLVTGYYEPIVEGSRTPSAVYRYPVFGVPDDLVVVDLAGVNPDVRNMRLRGRVDGRRLVPYYSRAEIEARGAAFGAPILGWAADPVELFFLQIQGSGQLQLESGERIRIGYADQNGHPFRSLGRYLIDRGELTLEQASMQEIKAWAAANPARMQDALNQNPSYVFFREQPPSDGPVGALGVPLSAGYSIAVDRRYVPLGAPVYLATTYPLSDQPLERSMAAQDTGGAIRGVIRADFYWGTGAEAGSLAGRMRQQGRMWLLWPRGEPPPRPDASSGSLPRRRASREGRVRAGRLPRARR
jgi:membrane-bound lytic murein transglycosylase A